MIQQLILLLILIVITGVFLEKTKSSATIPWTSYLYSASLIATVISIVFIVHTFIDKNEMLQRAGIIGLISYSIGAFLGAFIIPLILWSIYFIVKNNHNNKLIKLNQLSITKISETDNFGPDFNVKLKVLKDLLDVKAITLEEFEAKKKLLIRDTERLVIADENAKLKQQQLKKLEEALNTGLIAEEEYRTKVDKLK